MKIDGIPGEYFAQAFVSSTIGKTRQLCGCYHPSKSEANFKHKENRSMTTGELVFVWDIEWPVEIIDGIAYVPSEEELR